MNDYLVVYIQTSWKENAMIFLQAPKQIQPQNSLFLSYLLYVNLQFVEYMRRTMSTIFLQQIIDSKLLLVQI